METQLTRTEEAPARMGGARVVGVGASAGGLKPLQEFVGAIPVDSGLAYVVIMHLDPERESRIAELLQDRTSLPVKQIAGPTAVEPDHIYVTPPDRDLEMREGQITLRERSDRAERVPIDVFFRTLADVAGADAIGVVLSGTGWDGSEGIRAIREAGGITVAQEPEEADYPAMPTHAIDTGRVDVVLRAGGMPAELLRWASPVGPLVDGGEDDRDVEAELGPVFAALRTRTGHDFSRYKRSTVLRRLDRRLLFNGVETVGEYVPLLEASEEEADALMRDLLISVSAFFRDPGEFEALGHVIPTLFDGKTSKGTVRVWVVGCATGEEVYSIAMLLAAHAATLADPPRVQLFATDIDEKGYAWGRDGLYSTAAVAQIPSEHLERFFTKEPGGYRISKSLRESVLFAVHDVLRDPPFARIDLISCRNLFIYLQAEAQEQVLETFHYALNARGLLFLGASETAADRRLFAAAGGGSDRLYRRNPTPERVLPRLSAADPRPRGGDRPDGARRQASGTDASDQVTFSYGSHHVHMVEQYADPSLIVDEQWNVVHLSETAGAFLRQPEGEPARHILRLTHAELRTALRTALHQAFESGVPTVRQVRMSVGGTDRMVRVHVRPGSTDGPGSGIRFALIVFEEAGTPVPARQVARAGSDREDVRDLEAELQRTRDQLESTSAAYDRTVAELQTVNEELLSINEEQKAAAEELETGREEIQAINEELTTINQEHQSTIEELKRTNADLQNLIESTEIGTIFVDRATRIRRFTPAVTRVFNFAAADHGRPLGDITHRLDYPDLMDDVHEVLSSLERSEREVASADGGSFIVRINPYRSGDGEFDGAVLTFFDHSAQHRAGQELEQAIAEAEAANAAKTTFLSTLSHELRTPLAAIMGYAEILQLDGTLSGEQDHRVERVKAAGRHLVSMIDGLLGFVRLDGGREVVEREGLDARSLASDAHALLYPMAAAKGLTFEVDVPAGEVTLVTDVGKARQILANLCGNAVKYTETGGILLRLSESGDRTLFEVTDTGIGIAPEHHERIFERFWQVNDGPSRTSDGLGIGLAAARASARLLAGDVEVESELGKGSTFRLWLPTRNGTADGPARDRRAAGQERRVAVGDPGVVVAE